MILTKDYLKRLIREGKAVEAGRTTNQPVWDERHNGKTFVIVNRYDLQRVDHYVES